MFVFPCPTSLSMIISRSIHVAANGIVSLAAQPFLNQHGCLRLGLQKTQDPWAGPCCRNMEQLLPQASKDSHGDAGRSPSVNNAVLLKDKE